MWLVMLPLVSIRATTREDDERLKLADGYEDNFY